MGCGRIVDIAVHVFILDTKNYREFYAEHWDKYRPHRGEEPQQRPAADGFDWTGLPGNGPGAEILGAPKTALDLGPAEGPPSSPAPASR